MRSKKLRRRDKWGPGDPDGMYRGPMAMPHRNGVKFKKNQSPDYLHGPATTLMGASAPAATRRSSPTADKPWQVAPEKEMNASRAHELAVQGLRHYAQHGDHTKLSRLMLELSSARHRQSLALWCRQFGGLIWHPDDSKFRKTGSARQVRLDEAEKTSFLTKKPKTSAQGRANRYQGAPRCAVCNAIAIPGDDICHGHVSG